MEQSETPYDRDERQREEEARRQEFIREAASVELTPELHRAYRRFYSEKRNELAIGDVREGIVPHEVVLQTYAEFVTFYENLRETDPQEFLELVHAWRQGFETIRRELDKQIRESITSEFGLPPGCLNDDE